MLQTRIRRTWALKSPEQGKALALYRAHFQARSLSLYRCRFVLRLQVENEVTPDPSCWRGTGRARPGEVLAEGNKWISTCALHLCIRERCCEAAGPQLGCPHSTWRRPLMPPRSPSLGAVPCKGCCTQLPSPSPTEHRSCCSVELGHQRDGRSPGACGSLWHWSKWVCVEGAEPAPATRPHH